VRTTVAIDDELVQAAKQVAARSDRTLGEVVSDALRAYLGGLDAARTRPRVTFPRYGGSGLQPGVDLADKDALAELLDAGNHRAAG